MPLGKQRKTWVSSWNGSGGRTPEMLRECLWENSVKLGSVLGMDLVAGLQECAGHLVGLPTWKCSYSLVVVTHSACSDVYTCPLEK
jgi:hypothetical protein